MYNYMSSCEQFIYIKIVLDQDSDITCTYYPILILFNYCKIIDRFDHIWSLLLQYNSETRLRYTQIKT